MSNSALEQRCKLCGQPIESGALKCPYCQGYQTWRAWAKWNLLWAVIPLAVAVGAGLFAWQSQRSTAAKLEEMHRSLLGMAAGLDRRLTQQVAGLQADLEALSGRLSVPIEVVVTDEAIFLNPVTLSAYVRDFLRTPPTRRGSMHLTLIAPDLLPELRERAERRLQTPSLAAEEEARLRAEMDFADRLWERMHRSVDELVARSADLIVEPDEESNHRKPITAEASGSSLEAAFGRPNTALRAVEEGSSTQRIVSICDNYVRIQMYRCLHTLLALLPAEERADLGNVPRVITPEETWESLVRLIYREKGLGDWQGNPLAAVHLTGPGIEAAELLFPRDISPVDLVKLMREQPYFYLGSTVDVPAHISEDNWADHALWQMLSRYEMEPGFRMAWRPSDFTMLVQP